MKFTSKLPWIGIAAAGLLFTSSPARADSCEALPGTFDKQAGLCDSFGNDKFGAGYEVTGEIHADLNGSSAQARAAADASIFGHNQQIIDVEANAFSSLGGSTGVDIGVYIVGKEIFSYSKSVDLNYSKHWDVTFFQASATFTLGPIPITVTGSAGGGVGIDVSAAITSQGPTLTATPSGNAHGTASAGVGVSFASAGVEGNVTFLDLQFPARGSAGLNFSTKQLVYKLDLDLSLSSLSGDLSLYGKLFSFKKTIKLFSWNGFHKDFSIFHKTGCVGL